MIGNKFFFPPYCFLSLCLFLVFFSPLRLIADETKDSSSVVSNHAIILKDGMEQPAWMKLWGKARISARSGDKKKAVTIYRELFIEKPQIEEALREYVLLLMDLGEWKEAGQVIQKLLETDPASREYLFYGGRIALVQKRYGRASNYMGQVYTMSPGGPWAIEALKGQIAALQKLGRQDMAYPLMEQLYLLVPHDEQSIRQLARYSKKLGNSGKAQTYYKTLITEFGGTDLDFLESVQLFEAARDQKMLVSCWQGYLKSHPYYLPFHKKLSQYYLENNQEQKALAHLLVQIAHGEENPLIFLQTGKLYLYQEGRPDKALYYYEEYRKRSPDDKNVISEIKRIQAILANDLLSIVENEGAWPLWRDLAKVIPDRLAVYYSMAEQLESLGKEDELLEVLEIIHTHNPVDQKTLLKLAYLYFGQGENCASTDALDSLDPDMQTGKEYFFLRAEISEQKGEQSLTLNYYKQYLLETPEDYPVLFKCLQLAGEIGLIQELHYFHDMLPGKSKKNAVFKKGSFLYGEALLLNNLYSMAGEFYRDFLSKTELTKAERQVVEAALVKVFQYEKSFFEAEQQLRLSLIEEGGRKEIIRQLIQTNLLQKDWDNAWKWYECLVQDSRELMPGNVSEVYDLLMEKVNILQTSGQTVVALEMIENFMSQVDSPCPESQNQCFQLKFKLAELYYRNKAYEKAKKPLASLLSRQSDSLELTILDHLVQTKLTGEYHEHSLTDSEKKSTAALLESASIYQKFEEYRIALVLCEKYLLEIPDSLRARTLHATLLRAVGDDFASLEIFRKLASEYPGELSFKQNFLELQFKSAKFASLIEELAPEWKSVKGEETTLSVRKVVPEIGSLPVKQQLLLARAFWADKRFDDALILYKSLLQPPVDLEFFKQLAAQDIVLSLPVSKKSFLNVITFISPAEPDRLTVVMSQEFTREYLHKPEVKIAAGLYSTYRWQQIVSRELSVRQAMFDGNFYQAMKEYQKILGNNSSPESLYDLAGVYSRLGFLGKEAALYEIMKQQSPGYPDLDEASQRNSLKRRPRITSLFTVNNKDGRDGYYDIRQREGDVQIWFMPTLNHELLFDVSRIYSESADVDQGLWRNHFEAELKWSPIYDLDFLLALGVEHPDDDYGSTFLYDFHANGRIGDMIQGYLGLSQDFVDDTLESVKAGISGKEYVAGVSLDFLPRLFGGAEYLFTEYSDGNHQNRYELWSSYILHSEPTLLQLRYGYDYSRNAEGNLQRDYSYQSGFAPEDPPYWSPNEYWQHLLTISFEHQLAEDILGRGAPSYYTLEYSFGYEIGGYDNHEANAQIFLEMSRHFLLNSRFEFTHGAKFQEMNFFCSVMYRW
jgi:predicted Zn-dependent protease